MHRASLFVGLLLLAEPGRSLLGWAPVRLLPLLSIKCIADSLNDPNPGRPRIRTAPLDAARAAQQPPTRRTAGCDPSRTPTDL